MNLLITGAMGQLGQELQHLLANNDSALGELDSAWKDVHLFCTDLVKPANPDASVASATPTSSTAALEAPFASPTPVTSAATNTHASIKSSFYTLDITDAASVAAFIADKHIDAVINCAAATNVDGCETDPQLAHDLNVVGPTNLAEACRAARATLCHVSTDYVFSGADPMPQTEENVCAPQTVYGKTKLEGENAVRALCPHHFIVRTAWLYGRWGKNFVFTMLKLGATKQSIRVVSDQHGSPTFAGDLAYELLELLTTKNYGTYHCTNNGATTWNVFAQAIMNRAGLACTVEPCSSAEWDAPAPRPAWSILDNKHLRDTIGDKMPSWDVSLNAMLASLRS